MSLVIPADFCFIAAENIPTSFFCCCGNSTIEVPRFMSETSLSSHSGPAGMYLAEIKTPKGNSLPHNSSIIDNESGKIIRTLS